MESYTLHPVICGNLRKQAQETIDLHDSFHPILYVLDGYA